MLFLGFSSGLPFLLVFSTLSVWLRQAGIERSTIGMLAWVGFAYSFEFIFSPLIDRLRLPLLHRLVPWDVPSGEVDLYHQEAVHDLHSYRRRPTSAILELVRLGRLVHRELAAIVQPLLVLQGGRDGVVEPANADEILARASSSIRALRRFERSGHGMSVDVDKAEVAATAGRWMERFVGPGE